MLPSAVIMDVSWELLKNIAPSPLTALTAAFLDQRDIKVWIKRDDLLEMPLEMDDHAFSGNKWRKLKYNLMAARQQGFRQLLTFGGAYSNHLAAVAAAGRIFGFETVGIVRGDEAAAFNPTLTFARQCGMELQFVSREAYRHMREDRNWEEWRRMYAQAYILPEGGTNDLALQGCAELADESLAEIQPDYIALSCGTGGTIAGLIKGLAGRSFALGFSALKGDFLSEEVTRLLGDQAPARNWAINADYHFGGYAKVTPDLLDFMNDLNRRQGILLDQVYTAKLFFGVFDLIRQGHFPSGSVICIVHTGGLQGRKGLFRS